jgi:hypothetical protein
MERGWIVGEMSEQGRKQERSDLGRKKMGRIQGKKIGIAPFSGISPVSIRHRFSCVNEVVVDSSFIALTSHGSSGVVHRGNLSSFPKYGLRSILALTVHCTHRFATAIYTLIKPQSV